MPESAPSGAPIKRLPINPRRRKIPLEQRKRVTRACDSCNIKRIKCSGTQPCLQCSFRNRVCEYPLETRKVAVPEDTYKELQQRCALLQRCLEEVIPSQQSREVLLSKVARSSPATPATPSSPAASTRPDDEEQEKTGEGRILQDPDGFIRYMGESSGAAFMDRLREFVSTVRPLLSDSSGIPTVEEIFTSLLGRYHTHDSRPLLLPEVDPFYLPAPEDITKLLAVFQFYAQDGVGSADGGIYYWGNLWELEEQARSYQQATGFNSDSRMLAKLNAVLALACQYDPSLASSWEVHPGEIYFARAKLLLINPIEDVNAVNISILSLMGQYMLGMYRRDAAYLYIGMAGRTAVIHGLHKGWMIDGQGEAGEQSKRQFWNVYILDRWLSCLMGRPAMIPEEAVDVSMPIDYASHVLDFKNSISDYIFQPGSNLPPAAGLRAHIELSKIMDEIVNKVYGTGGNTRVVSEIIPRAHAAMQKLALWLSALPPSLQLRDDEQNPNRALLMLHMMYNQLRILCTRPLLFIAAKQAVATKYIPLQKDKPPVSYASYARSCAEAARQNSQLSRHLLESNQAAAFSILDYHYPFTAAIVLELTRLLPDINLDEDQENISFLSSYLCKVGEKGNESARDCAATVIHFGAIVSRLLLKHGIQSPTNSQSSPATASAVARMAPVRYLPDQSSIFNDGEGFNGNNTLFLDLSVVPENQSASYQEIFSWFQDNTF